MSSWSGLPEELWKLIFQHLPVNDRLGSCSRVCRKLHRAAVAATDELSVAGEHSESFRQWLQRHGQQLTKLELSLPAVPAVVITQVPCPNLLELRVVQGTVQLGGDSSNSEPGILCVCTTLTRLELEWCSTTDDPHSALHVLSRLPSLQHLQLLVWSASDSEDRIPLSGSVLQHLQHLTCLKLPGSGIHVTAQSLQHISCLQRLQSLDLLSPDGELSTNTTPGLSQLTALQSLELIDATISPSFLSGCTQLQLLHWHQVVIPSSDEATALLSVVGRQHQLQRLVFDDVQCEWPTTPGLYRALTASSKLQTLQLLECDLPRGAWQAMFHPDLQLPDLHSLSTSPFGGQLEEAATAFSQSDITRLVSCCSGLKLAQLHLQPDVELAPLSQLAHLTCLYIDYATGTSCSSLSAVTGLGVLYLHIVPSMELTALLPLTALQQLTYMLVTAFDEEDIELGNMEPESAPDVWLQLLEHCANDTSCQPAAIRSLGQQLAQQEQQISTLQAREAECAAARAAGNAQAAELQGRVAALEGQVAQLVQALRHRNAGTRAPSAAL